jgi:hypothetical protein
MLFSSVKKYRSWPQVVMMVQGAMRAGPQLVGQIGGQGGRLRSLAHHNPANKPCRRMMHLLAAGASGQAHFCSWGRNRSLNEEGQDPGAGPAVNGSGTSLGHQQRSICARPPCIQRRCPQTIAVCFLLDMGQDVRGVKLGRVVEPVRGGCDEVETSRAAGQSRWHWGCVGLGDG